MTRRLRRIALTPPGTREAPEVLKKPAAPDARTTQLIQGIRRNLDQVALDLPAFEAAVQGLACTPPDDATWRQLHATADRLQDVQRRLEVYIEPLTDPKLESSREKEVTLDELMRVNEKIYVNIQQFQSFERIRPGQEEVYTVYIVSRTIAV
ncbi:unnamed protein product [Dibothriocephalus latus]|uniref:Syntaxin N-terminal domain-containing protein n=1 Tax=Dibothriocephalus latus TaxID=60516 RepID=A0A3P7R8Y1_DIBLA|nr:unnamed protein product [Dibothriocephalus latus]